MLRDSNEVRQFYQKVDRLSQGFTRGPSASKDKNGNLSLNTQCALKLWREHFSQLLSSGDDNNTANEETNLATTVNYMKVPAASHDEVGDAI